MQGGSTGAELLSIGCSGTLVFLSQGWGFVTLLQTEHFSASFCAYTELPGSKTSFVISICKPPITSRSPASSSSPPGLCGLQQVHFAANPAFVSSIRQAESALCKLSATEGFSPCEHFYNITLFKTAPIKELKILKPPGWQSLKTDSVFQPPLALSFPRVAKFPLSLLFLQPLPEISDGNERIPDRFCWSWISSQGNGEVRREMESVQLCAAVMRQSGLIFIQLLLAGHFHAWLQNANPELLINE